MSNAIKMKKENKKQNTTKISQSIPAHFYRNYHPPKTPQINPVDSSTKAVPDFEQLPKISPTGKGINIKQTGGYSLTRNKHPMSMPARHGLIGPSGASPFNVNKKPSHPVIKEEDGANVINNEEQKDEPNSLEQKTKQLQVGSFTCFDVMNSPLKQVSEAADQKDNASATSAQTSSTFASGNFEDDEDDVEVAPEDDEDDEEGGGFEMEL